jgi:hypothetical protein
MKKNILFILLYISLTACIEPYESPVISPETGYLVVEGAINSGNGKTEIFLKRTVALEDGSLKLEKGAQVKVEAEDKTFNLLSEEKDGYYTIERLNLSENKKYKLSILTKNGNQYESTLLDVQSNTPIDSVSWSRDSDGVRLFSSTHDPNNNTNYYRWEFKETWEQFGEYKSFLKYQITDNGQNKSYKVVFRNLDDNRTFDSTMYYCWQENQSAKILLGSTVKLSEDRIKFPIQFIPNASIKLNRLYSINVRQYSLSKEAFEFFEIMKKNSELTGSIFDAQPAVLYGNIHNVNDPDEPVIGYMSICPIKEQRIFIKKNQIPSWKYSSRCVLTSFRNQNDEIKNKVYPSLIPTEPGPNLVPFPGIVDFYATSAECVDCRLSGFSKKPEFWPNTYLYE